MKLVRLLCMCTAVLLAGCKKSPSGGGGGGGEVVSARDLRGFIPDHHIGLGSDALLGAYGTASRGTNGTYFFTRQSPGDFKSVESFMAVSADVATSDSALGNAGIANFGGYETAKVSSNVYRVTSVQVKDPEALLRELRARMAADPAFRAVLVRGDTRVITAVAYFLNHQAATEFTQSAEIKLVDVAGFEVSYGSGSSKTVKLQDFTTVAYRASMLCWDGDGNLQQIAHDRPDQASACPSGLTNAPTLKRTIEPLNWPSIVFVGDTATLQVRVKDHDGTVIANPAVIWTSSDSTVGRIVASQAGVIRVAGLRAGSTFLRAQLPAEGVRSAVSFQQEVQVQPNPCTPRPYALNTVSGVIAESSCVLSTGHRGDIYSFTNAVSGGVALSFSRVDFDGRLELSTASGREVAESASTTGGSEFLHAFLGPGAYHLTARARDLSGRGAYGLVARPLNEFEVGCGRAWVSRGLSIAQSLNPFICRLGDPLPGEPDPQPVRHYALVVEAGQTITLTASWSGVQRVGVLVFDSLLGIPVPGTVQEGADRYSFTYTAPTRAELAIDVFPVEALPPQQALLFTFSVN